MSAKQFCRWGQRIFQVVPLDLLDGRSIHISNTIVDGGSVPGSALGAAVVPVVDLFGIGEVHRQSHRLPQCLDPLSRCRQIQRWH